jgi:methionine-rich copper-binding protein CopC
MRHIPVPKSLLLAGAFAAFALAPLPALAHAALIAAVPAADSAVTTQPTELRITFSEPFELAFTSVDVTGLDGIAVGIGALAADPADPQTLIVPLDTAPPAGVVTVQWRTVAADGHKSNGTYQFTVAP